MQISEAAVYNCIEYWQQFLKSAYIFLTSLVGHWSKIKTETLPIIIVRNKKRITVFMWEKNELLLVEKEKC